MSNFGKEMQDLSEGFRSGREARAKEVAARRDWLAQFQKQEGASRAARAATFAENMSATRQQRAIRLSELSSRNQHMLGRFRIEHQERCAQTRSDFRTQLRQRTHRMKQLHTANQRARADWRHELEQAHGALRHASDKSPQAPAEGPRIHAKTSSKHRPAPPAHGQPGRSHEGQKRGGLQ